MRKNQFLIVAIFGISITILLIFGIYFLLNNKENSMNSMMGSTSSSNNLAISLVLIAAAIVLSIGVILYFVYPKKQSTATLETSTRGNIPAKKMDVTLPNAGPQPSAIDARSKPFDVFLCYKKSSGKDFADHLKAGLEELGLHTFEDCKDIPLTVNTEEGWACDRDKALEESKYFVLIMTPGFDLSHEVVKEIAMARKQPNKTFVFFRHRQMGRNIKVNLGDEVLDIGRLEQVSFESKEELLRLASNILLKAKTP